MTAPPDVDAPDATPAGAGLVRADLIGTILFVVVVGIGVLARDVRAVQIGVAAVSLAMFAVGAFGSLLGYVRALERSRTHEIGVANLFLLTGSTAPRRVKRILVGALVVQTVVSLAGAIIGAIGLAGDDVNALAFGILAPMYGIAWNAIWAVRHGRFGPRIDRTVQPTQRRIG